MRTSIHVKSKPFVEEKRDFGQGEPNLFSLLLLFSFFFLRRLCISAGSGRETDGGIGYHVVHIQHHSCRPVALMQRNNTKQTYHY